MATATHIIGRQNIRVRYHGDTDAMALRSQISRVCSDELPVRLNRLFDAYDEKDFVLRIDKLDIHLDISDGGNLEETLAKAIIEKVEAALRQKLEQRVSKALSLPNSFAAELQFYLGKGHLPWWSLCKEASGFHERLRETWNESFLSNTLPGLLPVLSSRSSQTRLVALLDEQQLEEFILATGVWNVQHWKEWKAFLEVILKKTKKKASHPTIRQLFSRLALEVVVPSPAANIATIQLATSFGDAMAQLGISIGAYAVASTESPQVQSAFLKLYPAPHQEEKPPSIDTNTDDVPAQKGEQQNSKQDKQNLSPGEDESIFVGNAGLVLIALYLPAFFKRTNLLRAGKPEDQPREISLLRFLVYGEEAKNEYQEFEVVLEKLLCGIPIAEGVNKRHSITDEEKELCDELLQSAIDHWTVLKNTSPNGLRQNFLQREGRLLFRNHQWELTVQKQAHDILLEYLPWNISMIKLSWMPKMISVKWNS